MVISTLKDMEDLLKMCRKQGVLSIKFNGVELSFSEMTGKQRQKRTEDDGDEAQASEPTLEQLAFYSAGVPES